MYLQTSRLQYNLQKVGVFQTAHSNKNIQAKACEDIIPQNRFFFNNKFTTYQILLCPKQRIAP